MLCATDRDDWDVMELLVRSGGTIAFRAQSDLDLPSPPGCFVRGCTSGPRTRQHMEQLQRSLGFPSMETSEDSTWVPLLLH